VNYTSQPKALTADIKVDAIVMPAYHEKVESNAIPPRKPIITEWSRARTNQSSDGLIGKQAVDLEEKPMEISREELDAKLAQNKAEVEVVAAEMRREMAEFRAFQAQQFSALNTSMSEIKSQISGVNGEVTGLKGHIEGLKTTSSGIQWMVGVVLAISAILLALPQIQTYFKPAETPAQIQAQPEQQQGTK